MCLYKISGWIRAIEVQVTATISSSTSNLSEETPLVGHMDEEYTWFGRVEKKGTLYLSSKRKAGGFCRRTYVN